MTRLLHSSMKLVLPVSRFGIGPPSDRAIGHRSMPCDSGPLRGWARPTGPPCARPHTWHGDARRRAASRQRSLRRSGCIAIGTFPRSASSGSMPSSTARTGRRSETPTILVVEDEVLIRLMISEYLREFGYRVVEARTGAEARRVLQSSQPVDLVFSDIRMPGDM